MKARLFFLIGIFYVPAVFLFAQTHSSVPLGHEVYYILEQAQLRGLCKALPGAKPYSRALILAALDEIESSSRLSPGEQAVIGETKRKLRGPEGPGLDPRRGIFRFGEEETLPRFSANVGFNLEFEFAGSSDTTREGPDWGTGDWLNLFVSGDFGNSLSYFFNLHGGFLRVPREKQGTYDTYYPGYSGSGSTHVNQKIDVYSQPLTFFPYTYKKNWDAFVFGLGNVTNSGHLPWPEEPSIAYGMFTELSGSVLEDHLSYRLGRLDREWGAMTGGGSLVLNQAAQPFLGMELTARPFPWLYFSSLTGVLEYYNAGGIKDSARTNQNAFSLSLVEINYKNFFSLGAGSTAIWPKRFELGYLFPLVSNFLYQDNIGDFDNMAMFFNVKGQYPGFGSLWASFFLDEINPEKTIFELDRAMFAFQAGTTLVIPWFPFASLTLSYTKVEPYCYTHTREDVPWYGGLPMETAYTNNGAGLGYYLPPNSDELRLRLESRITGFTGIHLQYQMIRHGADYGGSAVDGSSLLSELDPSGRSTNPILKKYFLRDGAYQWQHAVKVGAKHSFSGGVPFEIFGEAGFVFSQFSNIQGTPNQGSPSDYSFIDTPEYPKRGAFILTLGFRLFPR